MANIFETTYNRIQVLKKEIEFQEEGSAAHQAIVAEYNSLIEGIEKLGTPGLRIWREYQNAMDNGNTRLDINDVVHEREAEGLVRCLRENGVKEFTFSSGWSSSVEVAWIFAMNGCKLTGIVPVNGRMNYFEKKHEVMHGYLFEVA